MDMEKMIVVEKSTKWWLTVATGGALAVGLMGGYGLATSIHGTNISNQLFNRQLLCQEHRSRDRMVRMQEMACHRSQVRMVKMVDQIMECHRRMVVQDKAVKTKECRLKTASSRVMTRARILLLSKMTTGRKTRKSLQRTQMNNRTRIISLQKKIKRRSRRKNLLILTQVMI